MIVETYEVTEQTTEGRDPFEIDAATQTLIEELDLEGQRKLLRRLDPESEISTIIPYRQMTLEEARVYRLLYPEVTEVRAYAAGPIPVRVLQVIAHARGLFEELCIWGPETLDPDPILIGKNSRGESWRGHDLYLLARWGDSLAPYEELKEKAIEMVTKKWQAKAREVIAQCHQFIENPELKVHSYIGGSSLYEPYTT